MNIVYIFGNGLDKAQGLATGYPDFYKYLLSDSTECSRLLKIMKDDISAEYELWSDMEERLGEFTAKIENPTDFESFYYELNEHLQKYLKEEDAKFSPSKDLQTKFVTDLISPNIYLGDSDKLRFSQSSKDFSLNKDISIISLNYTNSLEKILLDNKTLPLNLNNNCVLRNIIHVHGVLDDSVIIGVDNESQIANDNFKVDDDVKDLLIKEQSNRVMKYTKHDKCEQLINNANIVVLFGVSLGDTDSRWWQILGNNLVHRRALLVIQHLYAPGAIRPTRRQSLGKMERDAFYNILHKMHIEDIGLIDTIRNRLFFVFNSDAFRL